MSRLSWMLIWGMAAVVFAAGCASSRHHTIAALNGDELFMRPVAVGPVSTSNAVMPALAVAPNGTFVFFGGGCGARPPSCWCDVERDVPGGDPPSLIAGHPPRVRLRHPSPAQRLNLAGCSALGVARDGEVDVLATDKRNRPDGTRVVLAMDPRAGTYREWHGCASCDSSHLQGAISTVNLNDVETGAFGADGTAYLANVWQDVIQRFMPGDPVEPMTRLQCLPAGSTNCMECLDLARAQDDGNAGMCPMWPAVGAGGTIYYVDANDNTVRAISPRGHVRIVAGGGSCPLTQLARCGRNVQATRVHLKDRVGDGPRGVAVDGAGDIYINLVCYVVKVFRTGEIRIVAGTGAAPQPALHRNYPQSVPATRLKIAVQALTAGAGGSLYIVDDTGRVWHLVGAQRRSGPHKRL